MTFEEWEKDNWFLIDVKENAKAIWDAATLAEREACAKECEISQERCRDGGDVDWQHGYNAACEELAASIRMRSNYK